MPRDAFVSKIQRELCHPKCARKISALSRNGPLDNKEVVVAVAVDLSNEKSDFGLSQKVGEKSIAKWHES